MGLHMTERNPYVISFGKIPTQYISRGILIDTIGESLESDIIEEQAYKLTGVKGTGKVDFSAGANTLWEKSIRQYAFRHI